MHLRRWLCREPIVRSCCDWVSPNSTRNHMCVSVIFCCRLVCISRKSNVLEILENYSCFLFLCIQSTRPHLIPSRHVRVEGGPEVRRHDVRSFIDINTMYTDNESTPLSPYTHTTIIHCNHIIL